MAWPFTLLARAERGHTTAINSQQRYYSVRKPPASSPSALPYFWERCSLETRQQGLCTQLKTVTLEILPFCQESLKAVCASCGKCTCSSGAMRRIIWALLAVRLSPSITIYMMPLLPLHQAKFWGRRLCETHQKTLFPSNTIIVS